MQQSAAEGGGEQGAPNFDSPEDEGNKLLGDTRAAIAIAPGRTKDQTQQSTIANHPLPRRDKLQAAKNETQQSAI